MTLSKPTVGGDVNTWGTELNSALDELDSRTSVALNIDSSSAAGVFKTTAASSNVHALTAWQAATSQANSVAVNVVSDNTAESTVWISGKETNRGTLKITHTNASGSSGGDSSAAAVSIDLQHGSAGGTAAQGIFVTSTSGTTTGNLLTLRTNSRDDFVVKGTGRVGVGVATGGTPQAAVDIRQNDTSTKGLYIAAFSGSTQALLELRDSSAAVVGSWSPTGNLTAAGWVKGLAAATGSRPTASSAGAGASMFDTTLGKPIWSNGTNWVDATGTTV